MEILEGLWNTHLYYKGVRVNLLGVPMLWKSDDEYNKNSLISTVSRLRKNGLVEIRSGK